MLPRVILWRQSITPHVFLEKYGDKQLLANYVSLMNDPSREYYKCYEIDYDRHRYDGKNWTYVNLPVEDIKEMAIAFEGQHHGCTSLAMWASS